MKKRSVVGASSTIRAALIRTPLAMLKGSPDVSTAAHQGTPQMSPPNDAISATDVLKPGAKGPAFTIGAVNGDAPATDQTTRVPRQLTQRPGQPELHRTGHTWLSDHNAAGRSQMRRLRSSPAAPDPAPAANDADSNAFRQCARSGPNPRPAAGWPVTPNAGAHATVRH